MKASFMAFLLGQGFQGVRLERFLQFASAVLWAHVRKHSQAHRCVRAWVTSRESLSDGGRSRFRVSGRTGVKAPKIIQSFFRADSVKCLTAAVRSTPFRLR